MLITDKFQSLRKGLLELAVLAIVSSGRVYAADILARLEPTEFATAEGTLYPLLSRLRRDGLLQYDWVESEAGPPRKYYDLTATGKSQLADLQNYLSNINLTIAHLGGTHE